MCKFIFYMYHTLKIFLVLSISWWTISKYILRGRFVPQRWKSVKVSFIFNSLWCFKLNHLWRNLGILICNKTSSIRGSVYTFLEDVCVLLLVNFVKERGEGISLVNKSVRWWKCENVIFICFLSVSETGVVTFSQQCHRREGWDSCWRKQKPT